MKIQDYTIHSILHIRNLIYFILFYFTLFFFFLIELDPKYLDDPSTSPLPGEFLERVKAAVEQSEQYFKFQSRKNKGNITSNR